MPNIKSLSVMAQKLWPMLKLSSNTQTNKQTNKQILSGGHNNNNVNIINFIIFIIIFIIFPFCNNIVYLPKKTIGGFREMRKED